MIENEQNGPLLPSGESETQVVLKDLKVEYSKVEDILSSSLGYLSNKDKYDIVKFSIKVNAIHDYQWEVYRKPSEIKKNFAEIHRELSRNNMGPTGEKASYFSKVANLADDSLGLHISEIQNYYSILFQDPQIYKTLSLKEFFNISSESFNKSNNGKKPFEGWIQKKADPQCLRTAFGIACKCLEYFLFPQYNDRWFVLKDDSIYYMDESNSQITKNVYIFDKNSEVGKEGGNIISAIIGNRHLILKFKTIFEREIWYMEIMKRVNAFKNANNNI